MDNRYILGYQYDVIIIYVIFHGVTNLVIYNKLFYTNMKRMLYNYIICIAMANKEDINLNSQT